MKTSIVTVLLSLSAHSTFAASALKPPPVFKDKGACPFECCKYGKWRVVKDSPVFAAVDSARKTGTLRKGEKISAMTGEVDSVPFEVTVTDGDDKPPRRGEKIYLLTPLGERRWRAWQQSKVFEWDAALTDYEDQIKIKPRVSTWWIQVKTAEGKVGWVKSEDQFEATDMDSCP